MRKTKPVNESGWSDVFLDMPPRDKANIKGFEMVPTNVNQCKVIYNGSSVLSNAKFKRGDIIEICPCRKISKTSLYTREIRDMVFEVIPDTEYVIPMGYCQNYNIIDRWHPVPNCDYEWNGNNNTLVIRAICDIPKETILVINIEK